MSRPAATLFVCTTCRVPTGPGEDQFTTPGQGFARNLCEALAGEPGVDVVEVECLAVCKRACTVGLAGPGKWTYVIGDLSEAIIASEVVPAVRAYAASSNGIVAWKERPVSFRKGVIARIPPAPERQEKVASGPAPEPQEKSEAAE